MVDYREYRSDDMVAILEVSKRAWAPVFKALEPAVQGYVYSSFYPEGWWTRQEADIRAYLEDDLVRTHVAIAESFVVGFVGTRIHPEDQMGEVFIIAVDPTHQRKGIARRLMEISFHHAKEAGMKIMMVETGDDPGHKPSRSAYESMGFTRWPVARYFRELD